MKHVCPKCRKWVPKRYKDPHLNSCSHAVRKAYLVTKKIIKENKMLTTL
jgi:hypothetical protein